MSIWDQDQDQKQGQAHDESCNNVPPLPTHVPRRYYSQAPTMYCWMVR